MTRPQRARSTVRDLFTVLTGTTAAQLVGLLVLPFLARSFAPEAFGFFQLYLSLVIIMTVGVGLRIEMTLVSVADDQVAPTLAALGGLTLLVSLAATLALALYNAMGPGIGFPAYFIGIGLAANGLAQITTYWLIREQRFFDVASLKLAQVLVYAVVATILAIMSPTLWGLILADIVGRLAAAALATRAIWVGGVSPIDWLRGGNILRAIRANRELVAFSLPGALANSGGAMLTPVMIFHVFGAAAAGQYGLVDRSMGVPVAMIVSAGSQVFTGRISESLRAGRAMEVRTIFGRIVALAAMAGIVGALAAQALLPQVFSLIFGDGWETAATLASVLVFAYAAALVVGLVNQTLIMLRAFRLQAAWDLCWLFGMGVAWASIVTQGYSLLAAVIIHSAVVAVLAAIFVSLSWYRLRQASTLSHSTELS